MPELPDPCAEAQALRNALRDLAMGGSVARVRFGEDDVTYRAADMGALVADGAHQLAHPHRLQHSRHVRDHDGLQRSL